MGCGHLQERALGQEGKGGHGKLLVIGQSLYTRLRATATNSPFDTPKESAPTTCMSLRQIRKRPNGPQWIGRTGAGPEVGPQASRGDPGGATTAPPPSAFLGTSGPSTASGQPAWYGWHFWRG
jgi:hypothetical protein